MKTLFFLALLANLIFFLWQYNAGGFRRSATEPQTVAANSKQIWLLTELKEKPAVALPTIITAPPTIITRTERNNPHHVVISSIVNPVTPPVTTTAIIPVIKAKAKTPDCAEIKTAANALAQMPQNSPEIADYLVYYPAAATLAEAQTNMANLKKQGVKDLFIVATGEFKGAISLARFKTEAMAVKSQQIFMQKGISVQIGKRYKTIPAVSAQLKITQTPIIQCN